MQWEVAGTQGGTGLARSIVVNADDAAQARRLGARQGWKVESVHPVDDAPAMPGKPVGAAAVPATVPATAPATTAAAGTVPGGLPTISVPRVDPAVGRVATRSRHLDRAAIAVGVLGGLFVFAGVLMAGCVVALSPAHGGAALIAGLTAGLPVVAAGVMQLVTGLAVHVLSELVRAMAKCAETPATAGASVSSES